MRLRERSKLFRKRFWHRTRISLKYCFRRSKKEPTFILSTYRSGSNLLLSYLNSVSSVSFASEILNGDMHYGLRRKFITKRAVLRHIRHSLNDCRTTVCGAKLHGHHLAMHGLTVTDLQKAFPGSKFIILYRESVFNQYVSLQIAETTNHWLWGKDFRLPEAIIVDVAKMQRFCQDVKNFYYGLSENAALRPVSVWLSYEELASDPVKVFNERLFPFLGVPQSPIHSEMKKQNTKDPTQIVKNFGEIQWAVDHPAFRQSYPFTLEKVDLKNASHV